MKPSFFTALALSVALPFSAFGAGSSDNTPPTPTKTTVECESGMVYDDTAKACVAPKESSLSDDVLYGAVREFAYVGQFENAQRALAAMDTQDDRYLTYMGFTERKLGRRDSAMGYYKAALSANPDNLLARSYMGQSFVETGDMELAAAQLTEIRARGGRNTWPEVSLRLAMQSGQGFAY